MARVAGIDLPKNKRIDVALEYIYGIGKKNAKEVLAKLEGQIDPATRVKDLTDSDVTKLREYIEHQLQVEGDLRRTVQQNIKRMIENGSYRGQRHRKNLPVRGQSSKQNARTRKGPKRTVSRSKKADK